MNKNEILEILSNNTKIPKAKIERVYNEFLRLCEDALKKGEEVSLRGFGKFYKVKTGSRNYINPKTMRKYKSSPKFVIKFRMSDTFKYSII